ncbi:MAG TPA: hypothetical protein VMR25_09955 [Planctomycetaceae bacterium]|jgi:hypothetical protein|nr:hypothetical protein [Planctomycetaceae bacterium]
MKRSTMTIQRIQWMCPICKRRYAIPATAPTPSRCPQCRQAEEAAASREGDAVPLAEADEEADDKFESSALSALAAIQLEVAEEAARGPSVAAPILRHVEATANTLRTITLVYTVLAGLAVVVAFAGLLYGLHAAFAMPATHERTVLIFQAIAAFGGGLVAALTFFTFCEVIRILLDIEENTRSR